MWFLRKSSRKEMAKEMAQDIFNHTKELLLNHQMELTDRINELKAEISQLNTTINFLEKRFQNKELRDRQDYGRLHYKLNEVRKDS